ncbi:hypothetical protein DKY63_05360 [Pseudomonas putida]|uniref:RHS repeat-associated core domain-containing protein n=1 Tax=Pseudomonas putida TaxID=303 RepID=A0A2Z4REE2_PSEPU|nr:RHS repeat-associated core domain-containing protein [Pseudomonas putida]AWY39362.1 hypothetical protein DKY63_05360 [Pseudomonas putida]
MLAGDRKNTVFSEMSKAGHKDVVYTVYGYRGDDASVSGALGYNGELRESKTGWYFLGSGYRSYHPGLMKFGSPDSLSPFEDGGINARAYCNGDPTNREDPTGHWSFFSILRGIFGITKNAGTKAAGAGVKATKTATKVAQATTTKVKVPELSRHVSHAGRSNVARSKMSTEKVLPKRKGGFFEDLKQGKIEYEYTKPAPEKLLRQVNGPKFGDSLADPPSGLEQLQTRIDKGPVLKSMKTIRGKRTTEEMKAIRSHRK